jgi:hypothetical protein
MAVGRWLAAAGSSARQHAAGRAAVNVAVDIRADAGYEVEHPAACNAVRA